LLLADATTLLPTWLYATLPVWPLAGAIVAGLMLLAKPRSENHAARAEHGHGREHEDAHGAAGHGPSGVLGWACWPVVIGALVAAALGVTLFFDLGAQAAGGPTRAGAVSAEHDTAPAHAADHAASEHEVGAARTPVVGFTYTLFNWISLGDETSLTAGHWIAANFFLDGLTGVMMLFVTFVSLMVIIYAVGYMRDHHGQPERGYERFFAFLGLFVFSMCVLAMAGNFVLLYLGWELVGLCSYLLIGFYYPKPSAAEAAKKAFIVNRIGDFGFALGIFALYRFISPLCQPGENPLDYQVVFGYVSRLSEGQITLVALLLMCGALGKSAQFPLYVWLPDAMEGPTPVSALIHAATMVTAGIYMIARCGPIFAASEAALAVIVVLGTIGAVLAATMAMAQYDMKRILAYSTISQLAFMFVGLGVGAPDSAVFHVFTHAFFKALLFLCAGSVMHAMGNVIDLREFSGLRSVLPHTQRLMLIGCLALAGFPLLSGFWSKDELVHYAFEWHPALGVILLATAGLTAYYTFRMYFLCFGGSLRLPKAAGEHPHESPPVMIAPLYVLAAGAIFAGYVGVTLAPASSDAFLGFLKPHGYFHHYLHDSTIVKGVHEAGGGLWLMYVSAAVALGGIGLAWVRYGRAPVTDPDAVALGDVWRVLNAKYYVDELYDRVFVRPLRRLGEFCFGTDNYLIDGLIWTVAGVPRVLGAAMGLLQRGALQGYALTMAIGVALLVALWRWMDTGGS
jgi:NADH-quinone oxidoreductase subunit L